MIYFPLFANLNALGQEGESNVQAQAPIWQSFVAGCAAGSVAAVAVTPLDGEWLTDDKLVHQVQCFYLSSSKHVEGDRRLSKRANQTSLLSVDSTHGQQCVESTLLMT